VGRKMPFHDAFMSGAGLSGSMGAVVEESVGR
jgi:hypothetical protein